METLIELFITFFGIGLFTIGGGYAMIPLIEQETLARRWLSREEIMEFIAISESTPGPFAVNIATFIGSRVGGFPGSLIATTAVVLPSFIIILIIAKIFVNFCQNITVKNALSAVRPTVLALIFSAAFTMILSQIFTFTLSAVLPELRLDSVAIDLRGIFILGIALWLQLVKKPHPIITILLSGLLGILLYMLIPW